MQRHTTRHLLQQVMKLHWNLESLTQSGTIYEFLVEKHNLIFLYIPLDHSIYDAYLKNQ